MGVVKKTHYWRGDNPTAVVPNLTQLPKQIQQSTDINAWSVPRFREISSAIFNDVIYFRK